MRNEKIKQDREAQAKSKADALAAEAALVRNISPVLQIVFNSVSDQLYNAQAATARLTCKKERRPPSHKAGAFTRVSNPYPLTLQFSGSLSMDSRAIVIGDFNGDRIVDYARVAPKKV